MKDIPKKGVETIIDSIDRNCENKINVNNIMGSVIVFVLTLIPILFLVIT